MRLGGRSDRFPGAEGVRMPRMAVGLSVLLMAGVVVWLLVTELGCGPAETADKPRDGFASDRVAPAPFDVKRVMGYLEALCKIGPRISGSDGMKKQQELLTNSAQDAAHLSDIRYQGGATSYLEVLTNQTNYFSAELNLAQARLNELLALVGLYKALGGGWQQ